MSGAISDFAKTLDQITQLHVFRRQGKIHRFTLFSGRTLRQSRSSEPCRQAVGIAFYGMEFTSD